MDRLLWVIVNISSGTSFRPAVMVAWPQSGVQLHLEPSWRSGRQCGHQSSALPIDVERHTTTKFVVQLRLELRLSMLCSSSRRGDGSRRPIRPMRGPEEPMCRGHKLGWRGLSKATPREETLLMKGLSSFVFSALAGRMADWGFPGGAIDLQIEKLMEFTVEPGSKRAKLKGLAWQKQTQRSSRMMDGGWSNSSDPPFSMQCRSWTTKNNQKTTGSRWARVEEVPKRYDMEFTC